MFLRSNELEQLEFKQLLGFRNMQEKLENNGNSIEYFLTVGENNFGNKIPFLTFPADF